MLTKTVTRPCSSYPLAAARELDRDGFTEESFSTGPAGFLAGPDPTAFLALPAHPEQLPTTQAFSSTPAFCCLDLDFLVS